MLKGRVLVCLQSCHRRDGDARLEGHDSVALPSRRGRVPRPRQSTEPAAGATEEARQGDGVMPRSVGC